MWQISLPSWTSKPILLSSAYLCVYNAWKSGYGYIIHIPTGIIYETDSHIIGERLCGFDNGDLWLTDIEPNSLFLSVYPIELSHDKHVGSSSIGLCPLARIEIPFKICAGTIRINIVDKWILMSNYNTNNLMAKVDLSALHQQLSSSPLLPSIKLPITLHCEQITIPQRCHIRHVRQIFNDYPSIVYVRLHDESILFIDIKSNEIINHSVPVIASVFNSNSSNLRSFAILCPSKRTVGMACTLLDSYAMLPVVLIHIVLSYIII